jgi:asparagine synthase (glutamine-hydrolysing)
MTSAAGRTCVPFVDKSRLEAVSTIPAEIRLAPGKQLLLDAVPGIPDWVSDRPKQGFTFPYESWVPMSGEITLQRSRGRAQRSL